MKCNYNIEDLVKLIEDTMDEKSKIELEHHIEKCSKCNKNYTALKLADNLMQKEIKYSKDLYSNLIVRIDENRYKSHSLKYRIGFIFYKNAPKLKIILTAAVIIVFFITAKSLFPFSKSSIDKYNSSEIESQNSTTVDREEDSFNEYDIDKLTEEYIASNLFPPKSGKVFCAYKTIKKIEKDSLITQYLMVLAQEYYCTDGLLEEGTGAVVPVSITIKKIDGIYKVVDFKNPLKYDDHSDEQKNLFPPDVLEEINTGNYSSNEVVDELEVQTLNKAREFYMDQLSHSNISTPSPTIFHESIPLEFKNVDVTQSIEVIDKSVIEKIYTEKNIASVIVFIFKNSRDDEFLHGGIKINDTYYDLGEVSAIQLEEYPNTISIEEINYCNLKLLRIYGIVGGSYFGKTSYYLFHDGKPNNFLTVNGRGIERDIDKDGKEEIISCSGSAPYTYLYEYEDGYIKVSNINLELNADGVLFENDSNIFTAYYRNENEKRKLFEYNGKEMFLVGVKKDLAD